MKHQGGGTDSRIQSILRALSPDASGPWFELRVTEVIHRNHTGGEAGAHIGEFPSYMVFQIYVKSVDLGLNAELVGTFEDARLREFLPTTNTAMRPFVDIALERLNAEAPHITYKVKA